MKLNISQEDIDKAREIIDGNHCPTEYAMLRAGIEDAGAGYSRGVGKLDGTGRNFLFSKELTVQIFRFDKTYNTTRDFEPGDYEIREV